MAKKGLYIQLFSIHGLIRSRNIEMGLDADTGGQIKYVLELAKNLSSFEEVERVDLFTRLIVDSKVSEDYGKEIEEVNDKFRIIRIQCGGRRYIRKELLWPHLGEYIDKTIKFIKREGVIPDISHGHYADGGFVAMHLSEIFGIPFIFTGHSLGRPKNQKLLNDGMTAVDIIKKYKIDTRITNEEKVLQKAGLVVTSTNQEIRDQYGMYDNRDLPDFTVIPPGIDIEKFYPYYHDMMSGSKKSEEEIHAQASVLQELNRFFMNPEMPIILTLCRPDKRKNISGLIRAYGEDRELQAMANLAIFAGIRKNIQDKEDNERDVLTDMLLLMDRYDLYGKMAIPKKHDFELEVPELYRIVGEKHGIFVNAALTEPFGLTLLEASASGVPIVATNDGGPQDIMSNCKNGILVNPTDSMSIRKAIKKLLTDREMWETSSKNGIVNVRKHYTWEAHSEKYISKINGLLKNRKAFAGDSPFSNNAIGKRLTGIDYFLFTDIDNTLIGDDNSRLADFIALLKENRERTGFGVATGRYMESAVDFLKKHEVPLPDIIISSVGSEIYYGKDLIPDTGWKMHISDKWKREKIVHLLRELPFLEYQEEETQRPHKISYYMKKGTDRISSVHGLLQRNGLHYSLICSHDELLDILPARASKGKAIRFISYKWGINLENILVCGDSGNDEEMLRGEPLAVVVGNYSRELEKLKGIRHTYFARENCAGGIMEGIEHYKFFQREKE